MIKIKKIEGIMKPIAKNIMVSNFYKISPNATIEEAMVMFKQASKRENERRVFGMVVVDEKGKLRGMISMYDILLLLRPKHIHIWSDMEDIDITGIINTICERIRYKKVEDIMTTDVITVTPDTHIFAILDIMIKKHIRRIPVVEGNKVIGIVYISDVFYYFHNRLIEKGF